VFQHNHGQPEKTTPADVTSKNPLILPALPRVNKPRVEQLKSRNKLQIHAQPWTLGLVEAMGVVDIISRQRLETKNRIALILLDSNFEIALKEFLVHRQDLFPPQDFNDRKIQEIFQKRHLVISTVSTKVRIPESILNKVKHYYLLRNKLVHERATVDVTDSRGGSGF
jgi:hypothetical protein